MRLFENVLNTNGISGRQKRLEHRCIMRFRILWFIILGLNFSCIPDYLKKYRGSSGVSSQELEAIEQNDLNQKKPEEPLTANDPFTPIDTTPLPQGNYDSRDGNNDHQGFFTQKSKSKSGSNAMSTVVKSSQTVLYKASSKDVWDAALKVLLMNYNITLVDKELGVISTDWDNYYQGDRLLRNKVTMHIKKLSWVSSEVTINSSLEKYSLSVSDVTYNKELAENGLWLPDTDQGMESSRLFKNIARILNLKEPVFPYISPSISQDQKPPDQQNQRSY